MKNGVKAFRRQCITCCNANSRRDYNLRPPTVHAKAQHRAHVQRTYGLKPEAFDALLELQGRACAICHNPETTINHRGVRHNLAVDHNHATGAVRGLLCKKCNAGIGQFGDDPTLLIEAYLYLTERGGK